MNLSIINPTSLGAPKGYSNGVRVSGECDLLFVAGQVGWDESQEVVSDRFSAQFRQALSNIVTTVTEAGGRPDNLVRMTLYVTDKQEYIEQQREVGEAYRELVGRHYPAMTLVEVKSLLEPGAKVELEATAALERK